jgi:hypothetical protein
MNIDKYYYRAKALLREWLEHIHSDECMRIGCTIRTEVEEFLREVENE